jgi:hypothetical protein
MLLLVVVVVLLGVSALEIYDTDEEIGWMANEPPSYCQMWQLL